ncbi:PHD finger protein ALFIN-LIKE 3 [Canna indica]|uniref:PHD finger protein ALFIN-LIKE n=1 Tax=Canna indica TaxID=4628 RepID=A0AAQ3KMZ7_9LILI|nr:PHD finger protein ALFIN-LIKE 3 [Canna indica]
MFGERKGPCRTAPGPESDRDIYPNSSFGSTDLLALPFRGSQKKYINSSPNLFDICINSRIPRWRLFARSLDSEGGMDGGSAGQYNPRTVEEVFRDFKGRRAAMIKALTTDVEDFYQQCDPEKENLCLYGFPNERWEVNLPAEEVPPELPEPALGINFARDGMQEKDWLSLVAVHSDAWLLSVAFYFGARFGFDKVERKRLFSMINDLPTIYEVVNGKNKVRTVETNNSNNKSKSNSKVRVPESQVKFPKAQPKEEDDDIDEEDEEHGDTLCGACGDNYASDEFWICCDICETWFHGKCVKITPAKAEHIKQYKCPSCSSSNKKLRTL